MEQFDRLNRGMDTLMALTTRILKNIKKKKNRKKCPTCKAKAKEKAVVDLETVFLTAKEVQQLFDIKHSTYYRWIEKKWLVPIQEGDGSRHRYTASYIQEKIHERNHRQRMKFAPKQ